MPASWLSAHIFWPGPLNELLVQLVSPLITQSLQQQLATSFFFVRYAEGGPHIRLRLRVKDEASRALLTEQLRHQVNSFPESSPEIAPQTSGREAALSVRFVPYEPETERYGNASTMPVAEAFFAASSQTVLHWLQAQGQQAEAQRLTTALALHVGFAAVCMPLATATIWLRQFADAWLPHDPATTLLRPAEKDYWISLFTERYQSYQAALEPFVAQHWQQVTTGEKIAPPWLANFVGAVRAMHACYCHLLPHEEQRLPVYASLLHMTNNRLGIANHDEAFLAHLLATALANLAD